MTIVPRVDSPAPVRSFGQVFDDVAKQYDEARPSYPPELVDAAMERGGLSAGSRVLEVGSGTGKLTELLAERGLVVDAVEPGPNMIEAARKRLGTDHDVRFHLGKFEDVSLPEDAFAALFSATAFHWVDPEIAWRKAASHLVPGGLLGLIAHVGVRDEHTAQDEAEFFALLEKYAPEVAQGLPRTRDFDTLMAGVDERRANVSEVWDWLMDSYHDLANADAAQLFTDVEVLPLVATVELTAAEVTALFRTTSLYFRIDPAHRQAFEDEDRQHIERRGGIFRSSQAAVLMTARRL
jgi:ubiquinone/menaquinone biosynthesis C-methylase UbiE